MYPEVSISLVYYCLFSSLASLSFAPTSDLCFVELDNNFLKLCFHLPEYLSGGWEELR